MLNKSLLFFFVALLLATPAFCQAGISEEDLQQIFLSFRKTLNTFERWTDMFIRIGKSVGFIAVCFMWAGSVAKASLTNEPQNLNLLKYVFPIFVSILLSYYKETISGLDKLSQIITTEVNNQAAEDSFSQRMTSIMSNTSIEEEERKKLRFSENTIDLADEYINENTDQYTPSTFDKVWGGIKGTAYAITHPAETMYGMVKGVVAFFAIMVGQIAYYIMLVIVIFRTKVLTITGPLSLAFSLVPAYENSLANFFYKYLSYMLWGPLCAVINVAGSQTIENMPNSQAGVLLCFPVVIIMIFLYFQVPKAAADCIMLSGASKGSSAIGGMIRSAAMMAATGGGGAAAAGGGAAGGASGAGAGGSAATGITPSK